MDSFTIRQTFLEFYESHGHRRYDSFSLIPNDPTLLLTAAGMVPFKPYFLGDAVPDNRRAVSYQKVARTTDIENVGRTTRHLTFFEMLGNFSFGDYFKRGAITWAWELATDRYGMEPDRLWATVLDGDDESATIWEQETGVPRERIQALGPDENFWSMGVAGPCGPCSELYYDRGADFGAAGGPEANDERYLEFYNLVFMQYLRDDAGAILGDLPAQNVDTGMGLERMAVLQQQVPTIYETDLLAPMLVRAQELTARTYGEDTEADVSLRVIADHSRTATLLIADGVLPSKEGRGYVLRRLLRRIVRHARSIGAEAPVLRAMAEQVIATMRAGYPDLERQRELVTRVVAAEEEDFGRTLRQGLGLLDEAVAHARATGAATVPADTAFRLHDTYGFPVDLTVEIVADAGLELDREGFDRLMQEQRERGRAALRREGGATPVERYREAAGQVGPTEFVGHDAVAAESDVGAIVTPAGLAPAAEEGEEVEVVLARTPFYAEGGGQVGDTGTLETATARLEVLDTQSPIEGLIVHRARVTAGAVTVGQPVVAAVDRDRREATARSHSATHVLHATVRELLGDHAQQAGSLVEAGRLRFDFPHFEQVPRTALSEVEDLVNLRVLADPAVRTEVMTLDAARATGAVALFGEKYGERVRVVSIGDFSRELCGGTHVHTAARIGTITIVREESIGANLRRIEALTGAEAYRHAARTRLVAEEVARLLNVRPDEVVVRVGALVERLREAERDAERARSATLAKQATVLADLAVRIGDAADAVTVAVQRVDAGGADELRRLAIEARSALGDHAIVVVGAATDGGAKAQLVAAVGPSAAGAGVDAREILRAAAKAVGGGAGGSPELAQAGGRQGDRIDEALRIAIDAIRQAVER